MNRYKGLIICTVLIILYYSFGIFFYFQQGELIGEVINPSGIQLWMIISLLVLSKSLMLFVDVVLQNYKDYLSILHYKQTMLTYYPKKIYNDFKKKSAYIFDGLSRNSYSLHDYAIEIYTNKVSFIIMIVLYTIILINTHYFLGGITTLVLALSTFIARALYDSKISNLLEDIEEEKKQMTIWSKEFFDGYKEISSIWTESIQNKNWFNKIFSSYINKRIKLVKVTFSKNILNQLFIELPFLALMCFVFMGIFYQKILISQAFVWLGLSQFILQATRDISKNPMLKKQYKNSLDRIEDIKKIIGQEKEKEMLSLNSNLSKTNEENYQFIFNDNTQISLSLEPGLYFLNSENGSGKTTLLDTIAGLYQNSPYATFSMDILRSQLKAGDIRIIDANSVTYSILSNFSEQIVGPFNEFSSNIHEVVAAIQRKLRLFMPSILIHEWVNQVHNLYVKFESNHQYQPSLGERVIISCLRNWVSWHNRIKLLLIDECDSCLDASNKQLFYKTLSCLQNSVAIYMISHTRAEQFLHKDIVCT